MNFIVSNLERISKISSLPPTKVSADVHACRNKLYKLLFKMQDDDGDLNRIEEFVLITS